MKIHTTAMMDNRLIWRGYWERLFPRETPLIRTIPWRSGRILAMFCNASGNTLYGTVVPENRSIGK